MKKAVRIIPFCGLLLAGVASGEQIAKPHTFSAGTPASAEQVNAAFDTVYDQVNKVGAAITVDGDNNIGIGTAVPAARLDVVAPTTEQQVNGSWEFAPYGGMNMDTCDSEPYVEFTCQPGQEMQCTDQKSLNGTPYLRQVSCSSGRGQAASFLGAVAVTGGKLSVDSLQVANDAVGGPVLTADASGNVGIGTAAPVTRLEVVAPTTEQQVNGSWEFMPTGTNMDTCDGEPYVEFTCQPGQEMQCTDQKSLNGSPYIRQVSCSGSRAQAASFLGGVAVTGGKLAVDSLQVTSGASPGAVLTADIDGNATWQPTATDGDGDSTNELQTLTLNGTELTLSNGGGTVFINEYNSGVAMNGTSLQITDGGGAKSADLDEKLGIENLLDARYDGTSLFLGFASGSYNTGTYNLGIGHNALMNNTSGIYNTAAGAMALADNSSGRGNGASGYAALRYNIDGSSNTADGAYALGRNTSGSNNVGIGANANYYNQTGSNNTIVGYQAGQGTADHSKSGNVFLGFYAGYYETGNNKLYIDNSASSTPLIYGDFAAKALTINGALTTTGNTTVGPLATGNVTVGGVLSTTGGVTVGGTLYTKNVSVDGTLATTGNTSVGGGLYTTGGASLGGNLVANGNAQVAGSLDTTGNTLIGGDLDVNGNSAIGSGVSVSTGITMDVAGDADDLYVGRFISKDSTGTAYGLYSQNTTVTTRPLYEAHYGIYGTGAGSLTNYGVYGNAVDAAANISNFGTFGNASGGANSYGVYGIGTSGTNSYGVNGSASGGTVNYGLFGNATGGTYAYGVYGMASGGTTSYAGYFAGNARVTGSLYLASNPIVGSDERLKENIRPVENSLAKVAAINGVYYNLKDNPGQTEVGVIAQDVQKVLPEAVSVIDKEKGYLGVSYTSLIPVLIEAVKELQAENAGLKILVCQDHPEAVICR